MRVFARILQLSALVFFAVAAVHLVLGLGADALLGAALSPETLAEPSLDSQNRFYGMAFAIYGVVLWLCAGDLARHRPMLVAALTVFFLAGCARLVAWGVHGAPAPMVIVLLATELVLPPILYAWMRKALAAEA